MDRWMLHVPDREGQSFRRGPSALPNRGGAHILMQIGSFISASRVMRRNPRFNHGFHAC